MTQTEEKKKGDLRNKWLFRPVNGGTRSAEMFYGRCLQGLNTDGDAASILLTCLR